MGFDAEYREVVGRYIKSRLNWRSTGSFCEESREEFNQRLRAVPDRTDDDAAESLPVVGTSIIAVAPITVAVVVLAAAVMIIVVLVVVILVVIVVLAATMIVPDLDHVG